MLRVFKILLIAAIGFGCWTYLMTEIYKGQWKEHRWTETKVEVVDYKKDGKTAKGRFVLTKEHYCKPNPEMNWIGLPKSYSVGWEIKESEFIRDAEAK